jgi:hypothetical protein
MTIALLAVLLIGIALLAVLLIGIALIAVGLAADWDLDECAEINEQFMFAPERAALLKECAEPHPRHEPNRGIWRWKRGGRERYNE